MSADQQRQRGVGFMEAARVLAAVKTRVLMALTCRWMLVDVKLAGIVAARLRGWCRRARGRPGRYAPPAAVPCGHP
jgi:hypothetical protein